MEWLNDHLVTALIAGLVGSLITATSSDNKDGILRRSIDVFANTALSFYVGSFIAEVGELQAMYRPFVFFCCGMMGMFLKDLLFFLGKETVIPWLKKKAKKYFGDDL